MIDFELYRIFVEVAKEGNITKASEKLNVSQPAITKKIKKGLQDVSNFDKITLLLEMAALVKWLTRWFVAPVCMSSILIRRPIILIIRVFWTLLL